MVRRAKGENRTEGIDRIVRGAGRKSQGVLATVYWPVAFGLSVSWNCGVDFQAPAVDAPGQALAGADPLLAQPVDDIQAADPVMADHDERRFLGLCVEAGKLSGHGSHGDQLGAGDAGNLKFRGFANVDECEVLTGLQTALDFPGSDFVG